MTAGSDSVGKIVQFGFVFGSEIKSINYDEKGIGLYKNVNGVVTRVGFVAWDGK